MKPNATVHNKNDEEESHYLSSELLLGGFSIVHAELQLLGQLQRAIVRLLQGQRQTRHLYSEEDILNRFGIGERGSSLEM